MNTATRAPGVNDPARPVPLYEHVRQQISESILIGALPEGTVLPPEAILAERYRVAVGTVRRALGDLAAEGLVSRRRRTGTVVTGRAPQHSLRFFFHYFRLHAANGALVRSDTAVTRLRRKRASPAQAVALGIAPGGPVVEIERLRRVEGRPVMQECVVLDETRVPGFPTQAAAVPALLYLYLAETHDLRLVAVREHLTAGLATAAERAALKLPRPAAVLRIASVAYDANGRTLLVGRHAANTARHVYVNEVQ
jgi:GntR family transcriptional regulator